MSFCCESVHSPKSSSKIALTIALAGNPNSGKTTIFNALTGLRQKVANYPGVTVEKKTGRCRLPDGRWAQIIDLPGAYSLVSRSPDEQIAMEVIRGLRADTPPPDVVIVVVDASNLQRNLYLVSQLVELGKPMVVALNMMDVAERRGLHVSADSLQRELGVPVVPVVAHRRKGISELKQAILKARPAPMPDWPLPPEMKQELEALVKAVSDTNSCADPNFSKNPHILAERLLIGDFADFASVVSSQPLASKVDSARQRMRRMGIDPVQADIEAHYRWIEQVTDRAVATLDELAAMGAAAPAALEYQQKKPHFSDRLDAVLMHKLWGFAVFGAIMGLLFVSIFWLAEPIMGLVESGVGWLGALVSPLLPAGPVRDLWTDGIVAGVGAVVVFVPQIAILFTFLAILEDSGYLARAAFLMDRVLAKVGLHGKSFIPLLSSFACAIPGIMATRTIENRKDRLATIFVAPFMSCSARLPVYALLIGTFFGAYSSLVQGGIMLACYLLGIAAAAITAWIFKRTLLKGPAQAFILEMPSYKLPQISQIARAVIQNTGAFLTKAGTIIFCLSVILWAMTYYPRLPQAKLDELVGQDSNVVASEQLRYSIAGRFGHLIEPIISPLGYDWKMGVGLVGAFAAREVFVSTMGIVYSAGDAADDTTSLEAAMRADRYADGRPVWTPLVATSLLVWFVLAMQCMSTLAIVRRETSGWGWPIAMLLYMNALAYVVSLGVYQIGRIWFA